MGIELRVEKVVGNWCIVHKDEFFELPILSDEKIKKLRNKNSNQLHGELCRMFPLKSREYKLLKKWAKSPSDKLEKE